MRSNFLFFRLAKIFERKKDTFLILFSCALDWADVNARGLTSVAITFLQNFAMVNAWMPEAQPRSRPRV